MRHGDERLSGPRSASAKAARPRIMMVDDREDELDKAWADIKNQSYEIERISDPLTALDRARTWKPAVAVLDYMMYPLNGVKLAERLKALYPDILIIFVTADKTDETRQACLSAGAGFIEKPIKSKDLLLRVERELGKYELYTRAAQAAQQAAEQAAAAQWAVDARLFPDLSELERRLFDILLASKGKMVTRDALKEVLWGRAAVDGEDKLNTTMSRLRASIKPGPGFPPIIITRRGRGYLLDLPALRLAYGDQF